MLKCKMCLKRPLQANMAVLRSADRSIQYSAGDGIGITTDNEIKVKIDGDSIRVNPVTGELYAKISDSQAVKDLEDRLNLYLPTHNYADNNKHRPLVTDGTGKAKWATDTIGSNTKHVYLNNGVITASNGNVGSNIKPVYMSNGDVTAITANLGNATTPIYMQNGELKQGNTLAASAYRGVVGAIDNSTNLVPSSLIKVALDAINSKLQHENWTLLGNYKGQGSNSLGYHGWRGSVSVYKKTYMTNNVVDDTDYLILGSFETPRLGYNTTDYAIRITLPDTFDNLFPEYDILGVETGIKILEPNTAKPRIQFSIESSEVRKFEIKKKSHITKQGEWQNLPSWTVNP